MSTISISFDSDPCFYMAEDIFDQSIFFAEEEKKNFQDISHLEELEMSLKNNLPEVSDRDVYFTPLTTDYISKTSDWFFTPVKILTGELIEHAIPNDSSQELRNNLKTAREIISYVHNKVPFSENYFQRSKILNPKYSDSNSFIQARSIIETSFKILRRNKEFLMKKNSSYPAEFCRCYVEQIKECKIGNCGEMCLVGDDYGKKRGFQVECYEIDKGNHMILMIGNHPHQVIGDLWTGAYYPELEAKKYLMDFVKTIEDGATQYTIVRNFDSKIQTLKKWGTIPK
jgi:hypothetical protein